MPYSVQAKNAMLDHLGTLADYASVHDANPGSTGASEASGSTRGANTWAAASGGVLALSTTTSVTNVPSTFTVRYVGLWSASSGGTFYGYQQVSEVSSSGGVPWTFQVVYGLADLNANPSA